MQGENDGHFTTLGSFLPHSCSEPHTPTNFPKIWAREKSVLKKDMSRKVASRLWVKTLWNRAHWLSFVIRIPFKSQFRAYEAISHLNLVAETF